MTASHLFSEHFVKKKFQQKCLSSHIYKYYWHQSDYFGKIQVIVVEARGRVRKESNLLEPDLMENKDNMALLLTDLRFQALKRSL